MSNKKLIVEAHNTITRRMGKDYAPDYGEIQEYIDIRLKTKGRLQAAKIYNKRILTNK